MATQAQIEHIKQHQTLFDGLRVEENADVEAYFQEYSYIDDLYERVCDDLGITPIKEKDMTAAPGVDAEELQRLIQEQVTQALGGLAEAFGGTVQTQETTQQAAPEPQTVTFEEILDQIDPRDSEAALAMLDWLNRNKRLHRVGVLDGGAGYLFTYQEPKGSTKAGYTPGGTQGDRIVDAALDQQRASGNKPKKTGLCPHCFSAVALDEGSGYIYTDDPENATIDCTSSPDGKHGMA